jgi:hypothetical protein
MKALERGIVMQEHYSEAFAVRDGCLRLISDSQSGPLHVYRW